MNEENFPDRLTPDEIRQLAIDGAFESKALIQRVEEAVHAKWKKKLSETSRSVSLSPVAGFFHTTCPYCDQGFHFEGPEVLAGRLTPAAMPLAKIKDKLASLKDDSWVAQDYFEAGVRFSESAFLTSLEPFETVGNEDLDKAEKFLVERSSNAPFIPVDASHLTNLALHMIREVRDARKAEAGFSIDYQKLTTDIMHAIGRSPSVHKKHLHWEGWPGTWHFANTAVAVVYETVNAALNKASAKSNRYSDLVAIQAYEQRPPLKLVSETRLKPREEGSDK